MSQHLRVVHSADGRRYECEACSRKFKQKSGLTYHRRTVHGVDVDFPVAGCLRLGFVTYELLNGVSTYVYVYALTAFCSEG